MPMLWRRIAWFVSFAIAVACVAWMRSLDFGWPFTLGVAVAIWIILPFVISQLCAAFILMRIHRRIHRAGGLDGLDALAGNIADATKGLPPEEAVAVGKRMIDQSLETQMPRSPALSDYERDERDAEKLHRGFQSAIDRMRKNGTLPKRSVSSARNHGRRG